MHAHACRHQEDTSMILFLRAILLWLFWFVLVYWLVGWLVFTDRLPWPWYSWSSLARMAKEPQGSTSPCPPKDRLQICNWIQILVFVQQSLYWLDHFPSLTIIFLKTKTQLFIFLIFLKLGLTKKIHLSNLNAASYVLLCLATFSNTM